MKKLLLFLIIILFHLFAYAEPPQSKNRLSPEQLEKIKQFQAELTEKIAPFTNRYQDNDIIFLIGDDKITFKDIKIGYQNSLKHHLELYKDKPLNDKIAKAYFDKIAGSLIIKTILLQEVRRQNLYPFEEILNVQFTKFKNKIGTSKYEQLIKSNKLTDNIMKEKLKEQMGIEALYKEMDKSVMPPELEEIKEFYNKNLDKFKVPRKIRFSVIHINNNDDNKKTAEKNSQVLLKLRAQIISGEKTFERVAKNFSDNTKTRKNGGDYGYVFETKIPEIYKPVLKLKIDEVSGVFSTKDSFYIAKLTENESPSIIAFDKVQEKISNYLRNQAILNNRREKVTKLQKNVEIKQLI